MKTSPRLVASLALTAALATGAAACATAAQPTAQPSTAPSNAVASTDREATASIDIENIAFQPQDMTVLVGTEVTWTNRDANVRHTATSGQGGDKGIPGVAEPTASQADGVFDGNLPAEGDTYSHVFTEAGTFDYYCILHPSMRGTIVVE